MRVVIIENNSFRSESRQLRYSIHVVCEVKCNACYDGMEWILEYASVLMGSDVSSDGLVGTPAQTALCRRPLPSGLYREQKQEHTTAEPMSISNHSMHINTGSFSRTQYNRMFLLALLVYHTTSENLL